MEQPPESWRAIDRPDPDPVAQAEPRPRPRLALVLAGAAAGLLGIAVVLATTSGGGLPDASPGGPAEAGASGTLRPLPSGPGLMVDVAGAVTRPGVYALPAGSRVADAIRVAGGYSPQVDTAAVAASMNLAGILADGDKVVVPRRGAGVAAASGGGPGGAATGKIDLNRASASELDTLPGIGPVTAAKIVAARAQQPFRSVDELLARKVVSASVLGKIRDLVTVGG